LAYSSEVNDVKWNFLSARITLKYSVQYLLLLLYLQLCFANQTNLYPHIVNVLSKTKK